MGRRKKGNHVSGWVNLDKPIELGSTQAVGKARRLFDAQKAGHAGTLDPLASGILPIALGEATKTVNYVQDATKAYEFTVTWGAQTTTDDLEGEIIESSDTRPSAEQIESLLPGFIGEIEQTPPQFSAIKIDGERAYDIARAGEKADIKSRIVYIDNLVILDHSDDETHFEVTCGKGTYVRAIARDMGQKLGCFGHITKLRRTRVGPFTEKNAISLAKIEEMDDSARLIEALLPLETALDDIPALAIKADEMARLRNGQGLSFISRPDFQRLSDVGLGERETITALTICNGAPVALVEAKGPDIKPVRVLNL